VRSAPALHGFVSLEQIGGFGMPTAVDESFSRFVALLLAAPATPSHGVRCPRRLTPPAGVPPPTASAPRRGSAVHPVPEYAPMFLGHYGIAFAARRAAPGTSLGTTAFAAQFLDELWPVLLLLGLERVRIVPGLMAASPLDFVSYPISHSLLTAVGLGIADRRALLRRPPLRARRVGRRASVVSHWLLDAPMHRPDLPLGPGSGHARRRWAVELRHGDGGARDRALRRRPHRLRARHRARDRVGQLGGSGRWSPALAGIFLGGRQRRAAADGARARRQRARLWLFVPWSWWVDRHREPAPRPVRHAHSGRSRPLAAPSNR
jgi:hypothetical protein